MDMTVHMTNFSLKERLADLIVYREYSDKVGNSGKTRGCVARSCTSATY